MWRVVHGMIRENSNGQGGRFRDCKMEAVRGYLIWVWLHASTPLQAHSLESGVIAWEVYGICKACVTKSLDIIGFRIETAFKVTYSSLKIDTWLRAAVLVRWVGASLDIETSVSLRVPNIGYCI